VDKPLFAADSTRSIANGQLETGKGRGGIPMESVKSNRIYLWSKRLGAVLLIAMAIVAAGNAQQFSAGEKGKVNVAGATIYYSAGRPILDDPAKVGEDFPAGRWF
jgi:hypothetical protein